MILKSLDTKGTGRTALFAGSFNPFTRGHQDVVERGLAIFDRVVVAIGVNPLKPATDAVSAANLAAVSELYRDDDRVDVTTFDCLAVDFARRVGADVLLRGVRSVADFEYERQMADVNRRLAGIDTVVLFTDPRYGSISSSMVRELQGYGVDVSPFLPEIK